MPIPAYLTARDNTATPLPSALQDNTPFCAQTCITTYITQQFSCSSKDLDCLCSQYSSTGYTLGELAYGCLMTSCSQPSRQLQVALYSICSADATAVAATHTALALPTTIPIISSELASASTSSTTSSSDTTSNGSTRHSTTIASTSSQIASTAVVSSTSSSSAAAITSSSSTGLTTSQAIGISVGAFVALLLISLIVFAMIYTRRRRAKTSDIKKSRGSYDFVDEEPHNFHSFDQNNPTTTATGSSAAPLSTMANSWQDRRVQQTTVPVTGALAPVSQKDHRRSNESTRTVSQLLPDRLLPMPPTADLKSFVDHAPERNEDLSAATQITRPPPIYRIVNGTSDSVASSPRQPSLSLDIPKRDLSSQQSVATIPPIDVGTPFIDTASRIRSLTGGQDPTFKPSYILPSERGAPSRQHHTTTPVHSPDDTTPIEEAEQKRKAAPASIFVPHRACPERAYRAEDDSDTSFESTDDEDDEPPPQRVFAAAIARSPVEYPKVPYQNSTQIAPVVAETMRAYTPPRSTYGDHRPLRTSTQRSFSRPLSHVRPAGYDRTYGLEHTRQPPGLDLEQITPRSMASVPNLQASPARSKAALVYHDLPSIRAPHRQVPPLRGPGRVVNGPPVMGLPKNSRDLYGTAASSIGNPQTMKGLPTNPRDARMRRPSEPAIRTMALRSPSTPKITEQAVAADAAMNDWQQKLTPTRRGEDLYLSVNMITPGLEVDRSWPVRY